MNYPWVEPVLARFPAKASALPAAMMLRGQSGLGKRDTALYLARAILCERERSNIQPCGECPACHLLAAGNHPDLRLIEVEPGEPEADEPEDDDEEGRQAKKPSHQIKIERIRSLADFVGVTSHRGAAKVIVICPAEAMNPNSANALLKFLEEPPLGTYLLLVSHQPNRVPQTVRSRCINLDFAPPDPETGAAWLRNCGVGNPEVSLALAGYAPLAALNAFRDDAFWERRKALLELLSGPDFDPLAAADRAELMEGPELARILALWAYDLVAVGMGLSARYNLDYQAPIERLARHLEISRLLEWLDSVLSYGRVSRHSLNKRLSREGLFAAYPTPR